MLALRITSLKTFMNRLLTQNAFDCFLLEEAVITTANTFSIDGHIQAEFYPAEERGAEFLPYELTPWSEMRGLCFQLIKGKHTPLSFKFVLHLKPDEARRLLLSAGNPPYADILRALVLNIRYDGSEAILTNSTAYQTFVPSREIDLLWDQTLRSMLSDLEIPFEELV